jgi:hypothetical protein
MLVQFLKQPFPIFQKKWQFVIINLVCIATVLAIVASFMADRTPVWTLISFVGGFSAVAAFGSAAVIYLLSAVCKPFFDEKRWTKGKYFILAGITVLTTGVANSLLDYILNSVFNVFHLENIEKYFYSYLYSDMLITLMLGIIPTVAGYFFLNNSRMYTVSREKEMLNGKLFLRFRDENTANEKAVNLSGNTRDALTLCPHDVIYIEASGNYVHVHYSENGQITEKTLRATLLQMEEQLGGYPFLVRCHRAFIVNISCIENIKGRKIRLKSTDTEIPVSKICKDSLTG